MEQKVPRRSELPVERTWRLEDIFESDDLWEAEFSKVKELVQGAGAYEGKVTESAESLLAVFKLEESIFAPLSRVYAYAAMRRDEESTNAKYQGMLQRAATLWAEAESALAYITPEILAASEERIRGFLSELDELRVYEHALNDTLRKKPHTLSAREEQLLAKVSDLTRGNETAFDMLSQADIKFGTVTDEEGREVELSYGRYLRFQRSRDRRLRRESFERFHAPFVATKNTFAALYSNNVKADVFYARTRNYASALDAALMPDNVPRQVYDNLVRVVREHLPLLHRYFRLRKERLGLDELRLYDLFVPIVSDVEYKIDYDESVRVLKEALRPLGSEYGHAVEQAFTRRWIDVYENEGKAPGAYQRDVYGVHPYILLNYQGTIDDLFTLAHEMGHAIHSYFSQKTQPYVYSHYVIFVAEVASMVNEALLLNHLLATETDEKKRLLLLNQALDDFRSIVFHQCMFAEFEKRAHEAIEAGDAMTAESFGELYRNLLDAYYGPEVEIDPVAHVGWSRVPHFYSAFYVYKYATGFSAANALARAILDPSTRDAAVERYITFLSSGSSDYPLNLLQRAGVDMTTPEPIAECMAVFSTLLDEMEKL